MFLAVSAGVVQAEPKGFIEDEFHYLHFYADFEEGLVPPEPIAVGHASLHERIEIAPGGAQETARGR